MGEEASCNAISAMEAATNARPAKENGRAPAVAEVVAQEAAADPRLQGISDAIRVVPHFPKHGTSRLSSLTRSSPRPLRPIMPPASNAFLALQASCSTTSPRCCCAPGCSRTPSTCSSSATAGCASTPSPVRNQQSPTDTAPPPSPRLVDQSPAAVPEAARRCRAELLWAEF
jgi:hypothetical protein